MIREAYEAGVKQAYVDALADQVGSPAIKPTPPPPRPPVSPQSPTEVDGNKVPPMAMAPQPQQQVNPYYNEGIKQAMIDAGIIKSVDDG